MKNKSKVFISVISVLLLSVILFFSMYSSLYMHLFLYTEDTEDLNSYFSDITYDYQAMQERTAESRKNGATAPLNMPDVVVSLSKYDYVYLDKEQASKIIKNSSEMKDIHQVNTFIYSDVSKPLVVSNVIYFEFDKKIYAWVMYEGSYNETTDCIAVFSVNTNEMPKLLNDDAYRDYGALKNHFDEVKKNTVQHAAKYSILFAFVIYILIFAVIAIIKKFILCFIKSGRCS